MHVWQIPHAHLQRGASRDWPLARVDLENHRRGPSRVVLCIGCGTQDSDQRALIDVSGGRDWRSPVKLDVVLDVRVLLLKFCGVVHRQRVPDGVEEVGVLSKEGVNRSPHDHQLVELHLAAEGVDRAGQATDIKFLEYEGLPSRGTARHIRLELAVDIDPRPGLRQPLKGSREHDVVPVLQTIYLADGHIKFVLKPGNFAKLDVHGRVQLVLAVHHREQILRIGLTPGPEPSGNGVLAADLSLDLHVRLPRNGDVPVLDVPEEGEA